MTVVDSRGRRVPAAVSGRTFSGPPPGRRGKGGAAKEALAPERARGGAPTVLAASRRPGALAIWGLAAVLCLVGAAVTAAQHLEDLRGVSVAYLVAAPLAAGLVRRGRPLRMLVLCLPLAYVVGAAVAAAADLSHQHFPVTAKAVGEQFGQVVVLHPGWLWGGTALAALVGARRGLFRRRPR